LGLLNLGHRKQTYGTRSWMMGNRARQTIGPRKEEVTIRSSKITSMDAGRGRSFPNSSNDIHTDAHVDDWEAHESKQASSCIR
jgi:hypothetical protein